MDEEGNLILEKAFQPLLEKIDTNVMEHILSRVSCFYKIPRFELEKKYTEKQLKIMMGDILYNYKKLKENGSV